MASTQDFIAIKALGSTASKLGFDIQVTEKGFVAIRNGIEHFASHVSELMHAYLAGVFDGENPLQKTSVEDVDGITSGVAESPSASHSEELQTQTEQV